MKVLGVKVLDMFFGGNPNEPAARCFDVGKSDPDPPDTHPKR